MKKFVTRSLLALALVAAASAPAMAWKNSQWGLGLSWNYQSGGNSFLGGIWQNGQPPGPDSGIAPAMPAPVFGPTFGASQQQPQLPAYGRAPGTVNQQTNY